MEPENDGGNGAVEAEAVVLVENGEPVSATVSLPDTGGENTAAESEAVAIARIESETEIAVAAIEAETEQLRIEATAEQVEAIEERNAECHAEKVAALEASLTELKTTVENLALLLTAQANPLNPTPQPEPETEAEIIAESETVSEPNLTPQSIPESEQLTEHGPSAEEERPEDHPAPARRHRRLI